MKKMKLIVKRCNLEDIDTLQEFFKTDIFLKLIENYALLMT